MSSLTSPVAGNRRGPVSVALLLALSATACRQPAPSLPEPEEPAARPNVLLVVLDTTRADFFSSYGFPRPTTPRIDDLAADGRRYARAFATDFWTLPSHASLLTGLYPSEAGATSETGHLPEAVDTLAERLRERGYRTAAVSSNSWISAERGFSQGFEVFAEPWRLRPEREAEPEAVRLARDWIAAGSSTAAPFFYFVHLNTPHLPYDPEPERAIRFVTEKWPGGPLVRVSRIAGPWGHFTGRVSLDRRDFQMMRDLYAAEINEADELTGLLIDALETAGILDSTLVIITSDHGENLGEGGRIGHELSMYDTTLRVPLILRLPSHVEPGVDERLVSLVDLPATLLDLVGALEGEESRLERLRSFARAGEEGRAFVVAENDRPIHGIELLERHFPEVDAATIDHRLRAIRDHRHKLIWEVGRGFELYDLERDPGETANLAESEPEVRDRLYGQLRTWMTGLKAARAERFDSRDEESLEWLRALGYIE